MISISCVDELKALKSGVAKTMQIDFGVGWDVGTADADDEKALAMAIAGFYELGGSIISDDKEVLEYIAGLQRKQVDGVYR